MRTLPGCSPHCASATTARPNFAASRRVRKPSAAASSNASAPSMVIDRSRTCDAFTSRTSSAARPARPRRRTTFSRHCASSSISRSAGASSPPIRPTVLSVSKARTRMAITVGLRTRFRRYEVNICSHPCRAGTCLVGLHRGSGGAMFSGWAGNTFAVTASSSVSRKPGSRSRFQFTRSSRWRWQHCREQHLPSSSLRGALLLLGGFNHWFCKMCRAAGLPANCTPHGLRKAAGRRLAEAGCSEKEIAAFLGHESLREVQRYTKAADRKWLAGQAMERQLRSESEQNLPKTETQVYPTAKKL